jgi:PRTRC genetic system protein A
MKISDAKLFTPLYLKLTPDMPWPEHEKVFYLLSRDGLFLCRNHPFFRSCAPTTAWPAELAAHASSLRLNYPKVPQRLFEKIIGFFARIGLKHGAEAAVLLVWNTQTKAVEVIVPEQTSLVSSSWAGKPHPIEVHYEIPPLPPHLMLIGDMHSHVDEPAYASFMDKADEAHRPGLHLVVGRISKEPPEFHIEATMDGTRFKVNDLALVAQGYERRRLHEVPPAWEARVMVKTWSSYNDSRYPQPYAPTTPAVARQEEEPR